VGVEREGWASGVAAGATFVSGGDTSEEDPAAWGDAPEDGAFALGGGVWFCAQAGATNAATANTEKKDASVFMHATLWILAHAVVKRYV
jgi:hypothetical protein